MSSQSSLCWQWNSVTASLIQHVTENVTINARLKQKAIRLNASSTFPKTDSELAYIFHDKLEALRMTMVSSSLQLANRKVLEALISSTTITYLELSSYTLEEKIIQWNFFVYRTPMAERLQTLVVYCGTFTIPQTKKLCRVIKLNKTLQNLKIRGSSLPDSHLAFHFAADLKNCSFDWSIASEFQIRILARRILQGMIKSKVVNFSLPCRRGTDYFKAHVGLVGALEKSSNTIEFYVPFFLQTLAFQQKVVEPYFTSNLSF